MKDSPDAFGALWQDSIEYSDDQWKARLQIVDNRFSCPVIALWELTPAGLAWGRIEPEYPDRADLYQMWSDPAYRGKGIGRGLLDYVMGWAEQQGASYISLGVTVGNGPATRLYESAGFEAYGKPEPLRPGSDKLVQNMKKSLGGMTQG